ncbi:unnamed protein product [Paramecium sonneborni]|uniref:Calponin-homology (CH) domain-containing protein n=1 Tax=Paramecium sonneborni TaxID=65129 RepID=A0A8S1KDS2_9CILI|nr:unnamed protein product [Paramecium sonneborni]
MDLPQLSEDELSEIYNWVDIVPLSRAKKHIGRDFADGVLIAEIIQHYVPTIIDIHNYSMAHSVQQKQYNWNTLNTKVFRKMGFQITQKDIDAVIQVIPQAIERILKMIQFKLDLFLDQQEQNQDQKQEKPIELKKNQNQVNNQKPIVNNKQNDKDQVIQDQKETIDILELKIQKLEQLVKLKDSKMQQLTQKLQQAGIK